VNRMVEDDTEQKIERKAKRRAVVSGALTSMFIVFLIYIILFFTLRPVEPLITAFSSALCFSLFFSPFGGLAGKIGGRLRHVSLGAAINAFLFGYFGFIIGTLSTRDSTEHFVPLLSCCASAVIGAVCGGIGAMFGRTCREFEGKRFWPQFTMAELMMLVFLIAIFMSCLVTLRQILIRPTQ
jgi:hypothetical protein